MATAGTSDVGDKPSEEQELPPDHSAYECNICLDVAKNAVISMCGHLFCWPCLHQWLETRPTRQTCPVCKAGISKDKVIPLYGRGTDAKDPRDSVPPRPQGQRTEPENNGWNGLGFSDGGGFQMSFGIGAFPFSFFSTSFNVAGVQAPPQNTAEYEQEQFQSKAFLAMAAIFLIWLIFA